MNNIKLNSVPNLLGGFQLNKIEEKKLSFHPWQNKSVKTISVGSSEGGDTWNIWSGARKGKTAEEPLRLRRNCFSNSVESPLPLNNWRPMPPHFYLK